MSIGNCYLVEALLEFFKMENVSDSPKENNPISVQNNLSDKEKKTYLMTVLDKFLDEYIFQDTSYSDDDSLGDTSDDHPPDGIFNYSVNLLRSFMVLFDCNDAVACGNGEHLALIQKQMLHYFSSVSGYNVYAIEMLVATIQNEVLLSPAESHQCKWAALVNWKGGDGKNIEIDLLQENRNRDIKGLINLMGANKTEKAIQRMSKVSGGIRKIVEVFENQASIKPKSSAHSHKSALEDERKVLADLHKLKPFLPNPLSALDEKKFCKWLEKHQKNIALHFPVISDLDADTEEINELEDQNS